MNSKLLQEFNSLLHEGISEQDLADVLQSRIMFRYPDLLDKYGFDALENAVNDVASFHAGAEELGTSDISIMLKQIIKRLDSANLAEMDKSAPQPGRDGRVSHSTYGSRDKTGSDYFTGKESPVKAITAKQAEKDALNILKKQGVAEGSYKTYQPKHVAWVVRHGDGKVSEFKPHEDDAAKAQFDKVKGNRGASIYAIDQHSQSIPMGSLKAMRKKQGVAEGKHKNTSSIFEGIQQVDEINWKKAAATGAMALGALGAMGNAHAIDLSKFNTDYLQQVASGAPGRFWFSAEEAKAELARRGASSDETPTQEPQLVQQLPGKKLSREYLEKAADPNRVGRYFISVEKAQELLDKMGN